MVQVVARRAFLKLSGVGGGIVVLAAKPARGGPLKKLAGRSTTVTSGTGQFGPAVGTFHDLFHDLFQ